MRLCKKATKDVQEASGSEFGENHVEDEVEKEVNLSDSSFCVKFEQTYWEKVWEMEKNLSVEAMTIDFKKDKNIAAIYNPLEYAEDIHLNFMRKFLKKSPSVSLSRFQTFLRLR